MFIFLWLFFAVCTAIVASGKGRSGVGWFILGCLFSVFALILVACLPRLELTAAAPPSDGAPTWNSFGSGTVTPIAPEPPATKTCPRCAEDVKFAAEICRYCGHSFVTG